jgi:non-heme chloroperoxidase
MPHPSSPLRLHRPLTALLCLSACFDSSRAPETLPPSTKTTAEWRDPSPHTVRRVTVDDGVALEVLDWGGTGKPLVFLAGLGNTAHVFDDFAPQFTDRFHVLAITRRGFGASSQPPNGYEIRTRVADLLAALDSLHLSSVSLVGHSIAGDELTGFAARHPTRVDNLIYLDAASDHRITVSGARPPTPDISAADSASPAAVHALSARLGQPVPEAEIRATTVFGASGRVERDVTGGPVFAAITRGLERPPYERVRARALALYSRYESPQAVLSQPWWSNLDSVGRVQARKTLRSMAARSAKSAATFRVSVKAGRVIMLNTASHYVWLSNREEVVSEMRRFLQTRP